MKQSRARRANRHLIAVPVYRTVPDRIAGWMDITETLRSDPLVIENKESSRYEGGFVADKEDARRYMTMLRGGPAELCCPDCPRCEHRTGGVL